MAKSKSLMAAPLCLALLIMFVFAQSSILQKAGITTHATLQKFAQTINRQLAKQQDDVIIAVGSNDIHEKEFQVYFELLT